MMKDYKLNSTYLLEITTLLLTVILLSACENKVETKQVFVPQMDFKDFEPLLHKENDTLYIINFWATWCKPCVAEMPYFEKIGQEYKQEAVRVILVSLDFPNKLDDVILPFLEEKKIKSQVIHLTDTKANQWIDKVNPAWSGAIPATVFYKGSDFRQFVEGSMTYEDLKQIINNNLN